MNTNDLILSSLVEAMKVAIAPQFDAQIRDRDHHITRLQDARMDLEKLVEDKICLIQTLQESVETYAENSQRDTYRLAELEAKFKTAKLAQSATDKRYNALWKALSNEQRQCYLRSGMLDDGQTLLDTGAPIACAIGSRFVGSDKPTTFNPAWPDATSGYNESTKLDAALLSELRESARDAVESDMRKAASAPLRPGYDNRTRPGAKKPDQDVVAMGAPAVKVIGEGMQALAIKGNVGRASLDGCLETKADRDWVSK